jgi:hypothetical protein
MKVDKTILIVLFYLILSNYSWSQIDSPDISPDTNSNYTEGEVHISVSKVHPGNLVLSFMCKDIVKKLPTQGSRFLSNDYGKTWTGTLYFDTTKINPINWQSMNYGDPVTAFDAKGSAYICQAFCCVKGYAMQKCDNPYQGKDAVWSPEIIGYEGKPGDMDKEMIVCDDMPESPYANNFYCAWFDSNLRRVKFNYSTDGGASFSTPIYLGTLVGQGTYLQTGINGEVYVIWGDAGRPEARIGFAKSLDGGNSFPYQTDKAFAINGIGGHSFNGQLGLSFPSMAVDKGHNSNSHRGRIYVAYPEKTSLKQTPYKSEIRVRYSDDQGMTWPEDNLKTVSIPSALNCYHPCIAFDDAKGQISVVYYAIEDSAFRTNVYVAYSSDGGTTFNNLKVSDKAFVTRDGTPGGHYIGIAAYGGISYPAWFDSDTKKVKVSPVKFPFEYSFRKKGVKKKKKK